MPALFLMLTCELDDEGKVEKREWSYSFLDRLTLNCQPVMNV